ncbi:MAG: hypothetical protein QF718_08245 [Phycisphaerales bacterium]|jgi:hypothetical protein|nr:hypothetical protein [Phycisphaerales bacterium]
MSETKSNLFWPLGAILLVIIVLSGLRWFSGITNKGVVFDEKYITVPINNLIEQGWSVETAIDFQETKGPAMIWPYAFFGKILGGSLNDLRLVSVWCSVLGLAILIWIAVRCSLYRKSLMLVALGWLLLPYNSVLSEIVMGEVSFLLLSLLAVGLFVWSLEEGASKSRKIIAPILYGLVVAVALHSRIHIVALTGGICFAAFALQGKSSWPWWVASILAGLLRVPLWMRWGGLVSSDYQALHGLGFRLESLSYLAAAMVPFVGIFAIEGWRIAKSKVLIVISFVSGIMIVWVAMPDLSVPAIDYIDPSSNERFQGIAASYVKSMSQSGGIRQFVLSILAGIGLAGLAGLWHLRKRCEVIGLITFWSLVFGWLLYSFTRGFVFDRFLLTWAFLLPIIWVKTIPKWLLVPQYCLLALIAFRLIYVWLL